MDNPIFFITGASGFVGGWLAKSLKLHGIATICSQINILDAEGLKKELAVSRPTHIVHLAAISHPNECERNPLLAEQVNIEGTRNVLNALRDCESVERLLFASTAQVYQPSTAEQSLLTEDSPLQPINFYAKTKLEGERLVAGLTDGSKFGSVVMRIFNHVHKTQSAQTFLGGLYQQLTDKNFSSVAMVGNLKLFRDVGAVSDLIRAIRLMSLNGKIERGSVTTLNICSGKPRLLDDLARELARQMQLSVEFKPDLARFRSNDPVSLVGSHRRLTQFCGWRPKVDSIEELIASFLSDEIDVKT